MTYLFQCKVAADVLMLDPTGDSVLAAMDLKPSAKGIIEPDQMLAAIRAIEAAIALEESLQSSEIGVPHSAVADPDEREPVSLRQRAWPLIDMMRRAHAAGTYVVWGV